MGAVARATALTIVFPMISSTDHVTRKSGLTIAASDIKISKDGGAYASATNAAAELATSTGRYSLVLTSAEMDAKFVEVKVVKTGADDTDLLIPTSGEPTGAVVADAGNTASAFLTNLSETVTDYWKDALVVLTEGVMAAQVKKVSAYNGSTHLLTLVSGFTGIPAGGVRFRLVND